MWLLMNRYKISLYSFFIRSFLFLYKYFPSFVLSKVIYTLKVSKERLIFRIINDLGSNISNQNYQVDFYNQSITKEKVIWSIWLQGEENAPLLVKKCFESIRRNNQWELIVITKSNMDQFVKIPPRILSKYLKGLISHTSFSELLRIELLNKYGGLWVDSTIFFTQNNEYDFSEVDFLSLKGIDRFSPGEPLGFIPVFFMYSKCDLEYIKFVRDLLFSYWVRFDYSIDYFLIDYIFKYVYINNSTFKDSYDGIPLLGRNRFLLNSVMNEVFTDELNEKILSSGCMAYKLSNKESYRKFSSDGRLTVFGYYFEEG